MEKFSEVCTLPLNTTGFENLTLKNKSLAYYLSLAGLYGRDIIFAQNNKYNLDVKVVLESMYRRLNNPRAIESLNHNLEIGKVSSFDKFTNYLKLFWFHKGIYHSQSNKLLIPEFNKQEFLELLEISFSQELQEKYDTVISVLFDKNFVPEYKINREDGKDLVADSGVGFYDGVNSSQVSEFRAAQYPLLKNRSPMYGLNSFLKLNKMGYVEEEVASFDGLFSKYLKAICYNLEKALQYTENEHQRKSIEYLIEFYKTGDPKYFDKHSLEWIQDQDSEIYYINGFIECYDDPLGVACTYESLVAFKNPEQTEKVKNITKNIQWFEDNLSVDKRFKKKKASGLSASSITVCSMSGATSPTLPLGICLPNSEWIREQHGSMSVNLLNVHNSRESGDDAVMKEFFLPEYHEIMKEHSLNASSLHTDLHEITGHGSGQMLDGIKNENLKDCYNIIEECRADLVGLYYTSFVELIEFGVMNSNVDMEVFAKAGYLYYITKGNITQLNNIQSGSPISQTHMRNRYIVTNWVLENAKNNEVEVVLKDNKHFIKINDVIGCRVLFGELLREIQRIKSEGDYDAAKAIIAEYGTTPNQEIHEEVISRFSTLNQPKQVGFYTPLINPVEVNGEVVDYEISSPSSFVEDQLQLSNLYSL